MDFMSQETILLISSAKRNLSHRWLLLYTHIHNNVYHIQCFTSCEHTTNVLSSCCPHFSHTLIIDFYKRHPIFGCHLSSVFYLYWFTKTFIWTLYATRFFAVYLSLLRSIQSTMSPLLCPVPVTIFLVTVCLFIYVCVCLFFSLVPLPFEISNK